MKVPLRKRLTLEPKIIIERKIPSKGKVLAVTGQTVVPEDILAQGETTRGFRVLKLASDLGIGPAEVPKHLLKKVGSRVFRGDLLAQRKSFFGAKKVICPLDGTFKELNTETGQATLEFLPTLEKITSGLWGKIVKIGPDKIHIETQVLRVIGTGGIGHEREGALKIVCDRENFLLPDNISSDYEGRIIVGGALVSSSSLNKALTCQISGIVSGGIHFRDFIELGGGKKLGTESLEIASRGTDIGLSVLILEGFGHVPIGLDIFAVLKKYDGRYAFVGGNEISLTIPLKPGEAEEATGELNIFKDGQELPCEVELIEGQMVKITGEPKMGAIGKVLAISSKKQKLDSGLETFLVDVGVENDRILKVPIENLEVI